MSSTEVHTSVIVDDSVQNQIVNEIDSNDLIQLLLNATSSSQGGTNIPAGSSNYNSSQRGANIPAGSSNYNEDDPEGVFTLLVGREIATRLLSELFEPSADLSNLVSWLEKACFVQSLLYTSSPSLGGSGDLYAIQMIMMTKYVLENTNPYRARTSGFIEFYNSQPEARDYPLENTSFDYINNIFCCLLEISVEKEQKKLDMFFEDLVYSAFPCGRNILLNKQNNMNPHPLPSINRNIDISLGKMKKFLLEFEMAAGFNSHLDLKGENKVQIYAYNADHHHIMRNYQHNRLAKLYGIEMAGLEVLKTYTSLMIDKESRDIMIEYDLLKVASHLIRRVQILNHGITKDIGYTLLADKVFKFERKINSFWFRFQKEAGHRRIYKPVDYYFIIFSIFLGLLTVVQTVSGIVSLILQVKSS